MNQSGPPAPDGETMVYTVDLGNGQVMDVEGPKGATPEQLQAFVQQNPQDGGEQATPQEQPMVELQAQQEGDIGFNQAAQPNSKYSPEDEATLKELYRTADAATITQFMASKGFAPTRSMEEWVAARDAAKANGVQIPTDVNYEFPDVAKMADVPSDLRPGAGMAAARGVIDVIPGVDNITALARAADNQLSDTPDQRGFWAQYDFQRDMTEGAKQGDFRDNPGARIAGSLVGSLAIPTGLEGVGFNAGRNALRAGATMQEARTIAASAVRNRMAAVGGGYGAAHGALGAQDPGQALTGAVTEGAMGAAAGGLMGQVGVARANVGQGAAQAATPQAEMMQAAKRIGIEDAVLPADAGGPATRTLTAVTAQTPLGAIPIVRAANNLNARGAQVLQSNVDSIGTAAADVEGLGTAAVEGAIKYNTSARKLGGRMYDAAVNKAGNVSVDLKSARDVLDSQIARLQAVPGGGQGLEETAALRAELDKPFTVQGIRDWRTEQFIDPKFRNTPVEGRMKAVVNAASRDVETALRSSGKGEAADMYAAADNHWREMLINLKRNVEPIIGKLDNLKSAEGVASALTSASKNNGARLGAFVRSLPEEQRQVVTSTFLAPLGKDKAGTFSISQFAQDWDKMSVIAKRAAFPNETRAALDDLAKVGNQAKQAMSYANHSNTGASIIADRLGGSALTAGTWALGVKTLGTALAAQYGMGRLLAYPKFARWLARPPKTPQAAPAYVERLSRIAKAEPAIANEVLQLQQRLVESFSPTRLAANEGSGVGATSQPQEQQYNTQGPQ